MTDDKAGAAGGEGTGAAGAAGTGAAAGAAAGGQAAGQQQGGAQAGAAQGGAGAQQGQDKAGQAAAAGSILGTDGGTDKAVAAPADWPTDWREKLAAGDAEFRKHLDRYGSPIDLGQKIRNQDKIISAGQHKEVVPFPEKGTDAEKAAWRTQHNVPETPEGYKVELKNGMVIGEADKPIVEDFAKRMHGKNWSNAQLNDAVQTYYEMQDAQTQQINTDDIEYKQKTEDALRGEWGADYRRNLNIIENFLGAAPEGLGELLAGGRLADGRKISADPRIMKFLLTTATELNPAATLIPGGSDASKSVDGRLAEIRKFRSESPDKYDQDKAMQKEELGLLETKQKMQARGRAA